MVTSQPPTCSAHLVTYPDDLHTMLPAKTQSSAVAVFLQKKKNKMSKTIIFWEMEEFWWRRYGALLGRKQHVAFFQPFSGLLELTFH